MVNSKWYIARCSVFEPSAEQVEQRRLECGIPRWPHAFVTAHCDIEKLLEVLEQRICCLRVWGTPLRGVAGFLRVDRHKGDSALNRYDFRIVHYTGSNMIELYKRKWTKHDLTRYIGIYQPDRRDQIPRSKDGFERGGRLFEVWTGSGLSFHVLADRALDISTCQYKGMSLTWRSPSVMLTPRIMMPQVQPGCVRSREACWSRVDWTPSAHRIGMRMKSSAFTVASAIRLPER